MAVIPGSVFEWNRSPRLLRVPLSIREVTAQDIVDTCREGEASWDGLDEPDLIVSESTTGKQILDESTKNAITVTLDNLQIYFNPDTVPDVTGSATLGSATGITLIDSAATFITDGLVRGQTVFNSATGAMSTVLEITSETQLIHLPLSGPGRTDWQIGDTYSIYHNDLADLSGGNIVAVDINGDPMPAVLPSPNVQVQRTSSASATVSELKAIQYASFQGAVWFDVDSGIHYGDVDTAGSREYPVCTIEDLLLVNADRGFDKIELLTDATFSTGHNIERLEVVGRSPRQTAITIEAAALSRDVEIHECFVSGVLDGGTTLINCYVGDLDYINGHIMSTGIAGTIHLDGNEDALLTDCYRIDHSIEPVIDMGGSGQDLVITKYAGPLTIKNMTDSSVRIGIQIDGGHVILDPTITAGNVGINGTGLLTDNSTGLTSLNVDGLMNRELIKKATWDTVWIDTVGGTPGTGFDIGTRGNPSNNLVDALAIAIENNIVRFHIHGNVSLNVDFYDYVFSSHSPDACTIDFNGKSVGHCSFEEVTVTGNAGGGHFNMLNCETTGTVTGMNAHLENCIVAGTIVVAVGATLNGDRCTSPANTIINLNGTGSLGFANFSGVVTIANMTDAGSVIAVTGYYYTILDSSVTAGSALIAGIGILVDGSTGTFALTERTVPSTVWDEPMAAHLGTGTTGSKLNTASSGGVDYDLLKAAIWDAVLADFQNAGSMGEAMGSAAGGGHSLSEIADAVWDAVMADHLTAGTTGKYLSTASSLNPTDIAEAVWDSSRADHEVAGSFGEGIASVQGNIYGSVAGDIAGDVLGTIIGQVIVDSDSVNYIVDKVWQEALVDHSGTAGSMAAALAEAATPTLAQIAGAVWDEGRAQHVAPGSFGEGIPQVLGDIGGDILGTLASVESVVNPVTIGTIEDKDGYTLSITGMESVADYVWNELIASHNAPGSAGKALADAGATTSVSAIVAGVWGAQRSNYAVVGSFGEGTAQVIGDVGGDIKGNVGGSVDSVANPVVASEVQDKSGFSLSATSISAIADQVWDEVLAGHLTAGTTGKALSDSGAVADPNVIAAAVWNKSRSSHTAAGSFGEGVASVQGDLTGTVASVTLVATVTDITSPVTVDTVNDKDGYGLTSATISALADAVWDELLSQHLSAGSMGKALSDAGAVSDPAVVAAAVWNSVRSSFSSPGTFGEGIPKVIGAVGSVTGNVGGSVASVVGNVGGNVEGSVNSVVSTVIAGTVQDKTGYEITTVQRTDIATRVWASIRADHTVAGSFGEATPKVVGNVEGDLLGDVKGGVDGSVKSVTDPVTVGTVNDKDGYTITVSNQEAIAGKVWDEILTSHTTADSAGKVLADLSPGSFPTPTEIADAVWEESRSSHTTVGSFGEGVASVRGNLVGNLVGNITGYVGGNVKGSLEGSVLGSVKSVVDPVTVGQNDDKTGYSLHSSQITAVAQAVWNSVRTSHTVAGSFGEGIPQVMGDVGGNVAGSVDSVNDPVTVNSITDKSDYSISDASINAIADQVWNELRADHTVVGSFGQGIASVRGNVYGDISGGLGGSVAGSVDSIVQSVTVDSITDKAGYELESSQIGLIAGQVWEELKADHSTAGSFGESVIAKSVTDPVTVGTLNDKSDMTLSAADKTALVSEIWSTDGILDKLKDVHDEALGKWALDPGTGTMTLYRVNGDVLATFDLVAATAEVPAYLSRDPQ